MTNAAGAAAPADHAGLAADRPLVRVVVELDAQGPQTLTVLARMATEFSPIPPVNTTRVEARQRHGQSADMEGQTVDEHVERQACAPLMAFGRAAASRTRQSLDKPEMPRARSAC